jgi:hypothetical protein
VLPLVSIKPAAATNGYMNDHFITETGKVREFVELVDWQVCSIVESDAVE